MNCVVFPGWQIDVRDKTKGFVTVDVSHVVFEVVYFSVVVFDSLYLFIAVKVAFDMTL